MKKKKKKKILKALEEVLSLTAERPELPITIQTLALELDLDVNAIHWWKNQGYLTHHKMGKRVFVFRSEFAKDVRKNSLQLTPVS